jgi:hypothetical protein
MPPLIRRPLLDAAAPSAAGPPFRRQPGIAQHVKAAAASRARDREVKGDIGRIGIGRRVVRLTGNLAAGVRRWSVDTFHRVARHPRAICAQRRTAV